MWRDSRKDNFKLRVESGELRGKGQSQFSALRAQSGLWRSQRGQSLILVVLILVAVAALAGLFIALIASNQARTGRQSDVNSLQSIAEAGVRYADYQLTYSADGADWRPNADQYTFGNGIFKLRMTYNPQNTGPLDRFIKIESEARLRGNPYIRSTMVAYKPVLLADYLRFVTNKDRSSLPALLGMPEVTQGTLAPQAYTTMFNGPIRANCDLIWKGSAADYVKLDFISGYTVEAAGNFYGSAKLQKDGSGTWLDLLQSNDINFNTQDDCYLDSYGLVSPGANEAHSRQVRYLSPPSIDTTDPSTGQSRYLLLSKSSGTWFQLASDGNNWHNTGEYGYGAGVYVDNKAQANHNLGQLRNQWMNPAPNANFATTHQGWDTAGWGYNPPGVEIVLHKDGDVNDNGVIDAGEPGYPVIILVRSDGNWKNSAGEDSASNVLVSPYPSNGIIYAEGNIKVSGVLPEASVSSGAYNQGATGRFYDLTIVSGGTIYIEGDIMSPNTYLLNANPSATPYPDGQNTRVALLARDNACLNMTAFGARLDSTNTNAVWNGTAKQWELTPGGTSDKVTWNFRSWQPIGATPPTFYLRHAGLKPSITDIWTDGDGNPIISRSQLKFDATTFSWGGGPTEFQYGPSLTPATASQSPRVTDAALPADQWEVSVHAAPLPSTANVVIEAKALGDATNYNVAIAGFNMLPTKINIDALVYAQEGAWFVLPGPWFNGDWPYPGSDISPDGSVSGVVNSYRYALADIPLNTGTPRPTILITGAIAESHTAALGDAHDWLSKWSGPTGFLTYSYDAGLRTTPYQDANGNAVLRLPKLPCPPGLILWEGR